MRVPGRWQGQMFLQVRVMGLAPTHSVQVSGFLCLCRFCKPEPTLAPGTYLVPHLCSIFLPKNVDKSGTDANIYKVHM